MGELRWLGIDPSELETDKVAPARELDRLIENVVYSGQSQFSLSKIWRATHLIINTAAAAVAAIVGVTSLAEVVGPGVAGIGALVAAGLAAVNTALGAARRSASASDAANSYIEIRDLLRQLGTLDLHHLPLTDVREQVNALTGRIHEVNKNSAIPGRLAWRMSKTNVERGGQTNTIDPEKD